MRVVYNYIIIKNFRKHVDYHCEFVKGTNEFIGFNGTGKTTILDAIAWCLFGKNFEDKKKFNVFSENVDGFPYVELSISKDNVEYIITREIRKAVNARSPQAIVQINDVKFGVKEFEKFLDEQIGINVEKFKLLSNTNYAVNKKEEELRKLIYDEVNVKDEEIINHESNVNKFDNIKEVVNEFGIERAIDTIQAKKRKNKEDENLYLNLIENKKNKLNDLSKKISQEKAEKDIARRNEIKEILANTNELEKKEKQKQENIDKEKEKLQKVSEEIQKLKFQTDLLKHDLQTTKEKMSFMFDVETLRKNKLSALKSELDHSQEVKVKLINRLNDLKANIKTDREEFEKYKVAEIIIEDNSCPFCKQPLPASFIEQAKEKKKQAKMVELKKMKNDINSLIIDFNNKKGELDKVNEEIKNIELEIEVVTSMEQSKVIETFSNSKDNELGDLKNHEKELIEKINEVSKQGNEKIELLNSIQEKIDNLPKPIAIKSNENLYIELENINARLENVKLYNSVLAEYKKDIENYKKIEEEKNHIEIMISEYNRYKKYKDLLITKNIQRFFDNISFKTSLTTKDGKEKNCFIITLRGREYQELSNGEKLLASVSLIRGLQKMNNYYFPILIDNFESLSSLRIDDTQLICCSAMKYPPKTLYAEMDNGEFEEVSNPNYQEIVDKYSKLQLNQY